MAAHNIIREAFKILNKTGSPVPGSTTVTQVIFVTSKKSINKLPVNDEIIKLLFYLENTIVYEKLRRCSGILIPNCSEQLKKSIFDYELSKKVYNLNHKTNSILRLCKTVCIHANGYFSDYLHNKRSNINHAIEDIDWCLFIVKSIKSID